MKITNHWRSITIYSALISLISSLIFITPAKAVPNEWIIVGSGWGHGVEIGRAHV